MRGYCAFDNFTEAGLQYIQECYGEYLWAAIIERRADRRLRQKALDDGRKLPNTRKKMNLILTEELKEYQEASSLLCI